MLTLLLHVSAFKALGPCFQTVSTQLLMENRGLFTSLAHILAEPIPISFTAATIALADRQHRHNARNPDITQYPERVRGDTCCSITDLPTHSVAAQ